MSGHILEAALSKLFRRIEKLDRVANKMSVRMNNMFREAVVTEVDFDKGLAIVEAHGIESKAVPWMTQAGAVNEWNPLSKNQRVMLVSPGGDMGRAFIIPGGYTDETKAPHDKGGEKRVTIGGALITHSAQGLAIVIDGSKFTFTKSGLELEIDGVKFAFTGEGFDQKGGRQRHDDKNVGSDHVHGGVESGSDKTVGPE